MIQRVDAIIKVKRGLDADRKTAFLSAGELAYTTDTKRFFIGDDSNGGVPVSIRTHFNDRLTNNALPGDFYVDNNQGDGLTKFYILTGADHTNLSNYVFVANNAADTALTVVSANSAYWGIQGGATGGIAYNNLVANSANWDATYTNFSTNSAAYGKKYIGVFGDGVAKYFIITHNLDSQDAVANVIDNTTNEVVYPAIEYMNNTQLKITFNTAPATDAYRVVVVA